MSTLLCIAGPNLWTSPGQRLGMQSPGASPFSGGSTVQRLETVYSSEPLQPAWLHQQWHLNPCAVVLCASSTAANLTAEMRLISWGCSSFCEQVQYISLIMMPAESAKVSHTLQEPQRKERRWRFWVLQAIAWGGAKQFRKALMQGLPS